VTATAARAPTPSHLLGGVALLCVAAVGIALWTQHGLGMHPCPYCILQRMIFCAIALVALAGLALRAPVARIATLAAVDLLATAGIVTGLYQHFVAASSTSCNLTLADRIIGASGLDGWLPAVFAPEASCADAAVKLLGVPYEFFAVALFVLIGAAAAWGIVRVARRAGAT
jgi:disulfide bond formation protein DsbB